MKILKLNRQRGNVVLSRRAVLEKGREEKRRRLSTIPGVVPSLFKLSEGCLFHERCVEAREDCRRIEPSIINLGNGHRVRCHNYA